MRILYLFGIALLLVFSSCSLESGTQNESSYEDNSSSGYSDQETTDDAESSYSSDCKFDDGTYSSTVDYYNPETGYSATYTLDVDVQNCQVVQINFPNDGYLDEDHISYADIDENGDASVDGENGKTYDIHIDE